MRSRRGRAGPASDAAHRPHFMKNESPARHGFSEARLAVLTRRIQADIDAGRIPGAAMLIARNGAVVHEQALGFQAPGSGVPMAVDSVFRIYSMTKPIVSVAAMMLVEQGRLMLSDPVTRHLPELAGLNVGIEAPDAASGTLRLVEAERPPTVHDLLRHTSGFTYGIFGDSPVKRAYLKARVGHPDSTSDEFVRALAQVPLAYQPGTVWEYGVSTDVLGVLVERIAGMPLDVFLDQAILHPLGMHDTGFWVPAQQRHRIAEPFATDPVTGNPVQLRQAGERPVFLSGGGGMMSTLHDYLRFAQMLLNEGALGEVRLLSRKTLRYMASDHLGELPQARQGAGFLPGPGYGFGLGFAVRTGAGAAIIPGTVGDYTWSGLAGTYFWIDPGENMLAIWMMQAPEQRDHYRQLFRNLVYAALE